MIRDRQKEKMKIIIIYDIKTPSFVSHVYIFTHFRVPSNTYTQKAQRQSKDLARLERIVELK